jgi:hypothetical protein
VLASPRRKNGPASATKGGGGGGRGRVLPVMSPKTTTISDTSESTNTNNERMRSIHPLVRERLRSPRASGRRPKKSTMRDWSVRRTNDWLPHASANWNALADNASKKRHPLMACGSRVRFIPVLVTLAYHRLSYSDRTGKNEVCRSRIA